MRFKGYSKTTVTMLALALALSCGEKKSEDESTSGLGFEPGTLNLAKFPDSSGMVSVNTASLNLAPSGTVPKISELADKYDQYFFNGSVAAITSTQSANGAQKGDLDRGEAVCGNMGSVAQSFSQLKGGSLCYMKKVPKLSSDTIALVQGSESVTSENLAESLFAQEAEDKLVKVQITMEEEPGQTVQQDIFINVIGKNTAGNKYVFKMYGCMQGQVDSTETVSLDYDTSVYTSENSHKFSDTDSGQTSSQKQTITAYLKKQGDDLVWDLAKDRTIDESFSHGGSYGTNYGNAKYVIDGNNYLTSYIHSKGSWPGPDNQTNSNTQKLWSKSAFSGDSALSLQVSEMAMAFNDSFSFSGQNDSREVKGAVEFQDTKYAETTSSALHSEVEKIDFSQAIYQAAPEQVSVDLSGNDCNAAAKVIVSFDMRTSEAASVEQACEGDRDQWAKLDALYDACYGQEVQTARQYTWQQQ